MESAAIPVESSPPSTSVQMVSMVAAVVTSTMSSSSSSASAASSSSSALASSTHATSTFKIIGVCLAIGSGFFIGCSFVVKKKGLLAATSKYGNSAGEGFGYLKSWIWWTGMTMMVIGEILNFVAYAFTEAILVTPMGALSVVICAIMSHFFLKESLTFFGWIGCTLCILGATILALNAPQQQSVTTIDGFQHLFLSPGFLVWGSILIITSLVLIFWAAPKWGKKNMMPYISICSLIGGISVSCTQGLGASIVTSIGGDNQVTHWFFWFLFVFVIVTLLTELQYLNKALELFNTSMVVPVYFCYFSSSTLITSFILYQGLKASIITILTMVMGFLVICMGITLLQMSKVDPTTFSKMDRKSTMLFQAAKHQTEEAEKGEVTAMEDPGMDALRGGFGAVGSIIRARTVSRKYSAAGGYGKVQPYNSAGNLSTLGLGQVQRYQLSDTPMPHDAMDQVSLYSAKSPQSGSTQSGFFPTRSKSQLKFEEADVVHQYGYGRHEEPNHSVRPHAQHQNSNVNTASLASGPAGQPAFLTNRQASANSIYPPVMEEPEEEEDVRDIGSAQMRKADARSGYTDHYPQTHRSETPKTTDSKTTGIRGPRDLPRDQSAHDDSRTSRMSRSSKRSDGGHSKSSRKSRRDYPQSSKRDAADREERRALVDREEPEEYLDEQDRQRSDSDASGTSRAESYEEPRSAVTDESMGHVFVAERRLAGSSGPGGRAEGIPPLPSSAPMSAGGSSRSWRPI